MIVTAIAIAAPAAGQQLPGKVAAPEILKVEPPKSGEFVTPERAPVPPVRPPETLMGEPEPDDKPRAPAPPEASATPPANRQAPSDTELACRARLVALGAQFKEAAPVTDPGGCSMPHPIELSRMSQTIAIAPGVVLNCATAEAASRFMRDVASPAAKAGLGADIKSVAQASGFVCRPRNGTSKLSEHAFGNALDIASFTLTDDRVIAVEPAPAAASLSFLRKVRDAACGPFKTVLGPGSNADHDLHLHFDLAQRRNGGTYCK